MAGRYATALFDLAREADALERVDAELTAFGGLLDESDDLARLVRSPVFSAADQARALSAVLDAAGIEGLSANFLNLIAQNRRLFAVKDMISGFRVLLAQLKGEVTAEVASAAALSDDQSEALRAALGQALQQDVQLACRVEPRLLGGLIVKVGSRMIDNSLRTKLDTLKFAMKEVG